MRDQAGFFDIDERLRELSAKGDDLDRWRRSLISSCSGRTAPQSRLRRSDARRGRLWSALRFPTAFIN